MALATEIVQLRAELGAAARVGEGPQEIMLPPPPVPPDAPPTRLPLHDLAAEPSQQRE